MLRIGQGFDVHKLVENRKLILGGVEIPYIYGLEGHSDADVLIHALMDALLGALALGDIGLFFPDSDIRYKNADSMLLLRLIMEHPALQNTKINNLDLTVIAQAPKIRPYVDLMRSRIGEVMNLPIERISVKGTTTEKLGFTGRGEGIAALAAVLIETP